ncbi:amidohydrolase family protein [Marinicella sp. W31]|uniref:amidohydrolase family protein n=1 Tax=Marinicella sp. W31 TaxID=3023713 RepID=UPI0037573864
MPYFLIILAYSLIATDSNAKTAYTNFQWIDPLDQTIHSNILLIEDQGRIKYIGPPQLLTDDYHRVDLGNRFVIAGFVDTHTHVTLGAVELKKQQDTISLEANNSDAISRYNGLVLLAHGITRIRNPGGDTQRSVHYKKQVDQDHWIGPSATVAGQLLDANTFPGLSTAVTTATQIETEIRQQKAQGVDFIKLYTGLTPEQLQTAIKSAHNHGLKAVAHLESIPWGTAAEYGLDGIVHAMPISPDLLPQAGRQQYLENSRPGAFGFFEWYEQADFEAPRFKQFMHKLANSNISIDLTLIAFRNAFWGDQTQVTQHPKLNLAHPDLVNNWRSFFTFNVGWQEADFKRAKATWPKVESFVRQLHQADIHLTVGTDMNNPWVIPGVSFHQEMQLLAAAGIPNYDVLKMATLHGAEATGATATEGSLSVGKKASFVILERNPVKDIRNTQSIYAVVHNGKLWQPDQLLNMRFEVQ